MVVRLPLAEQQEAAVEQWHLGEQGLFVKVCPIRAVTLLLQRSARIAIGCSQTSSDQDSKQIVQRRDVDTRRRHLARYRRKGSL